MSRSERNRFEIDEAKAVIYARAGGQCEYVDEQGSRCQKTGIEIAHICPQDDMHIKIYGTEIIHHKDNVLLTCIPHNTTVELDVKTQPMKVAEHIARLRAKIEEDKRETD